MISISRCSDWLSPRLWGEFLHWPNSLFLGGPRGSDRRDKESKQAVTIVSSFLFRSFQRWRTLVGQVNAPIQQHVIRSISSCGREPQWDWHPVPAQLRPRSPGSVPEENNALLSNCVTVETPQRYGPCLPQRWTLGLCGRKGKTLNLKVLIYLLETKRSRKATGRIAIVSEVLRVSNCSAITQIGRASCRERV